MSNRSKFRPCIDLHEGAVKQIVGGTLDSSNESLQTNFVSDQSPGWFAGKYASDQLTGGHVIQLGPGNTEAAREALAGYPNGLQIGGGISAENASEWLEAGASHVIVTSSLFDPDGKFLLDQLDRLVAAVGAERLVIDLSCRRTANGWTVAMNRWQTLTDVEVTAETLEQLSDSCAEFLIHAADVEGKCGGIDSELVSFLGDWGKIPITYAGGARDLSDLELVQELSGGRLDLTIGSALDIFGGSGVTYEECVRYNRQNPSPV